MVHDLGVMSVAARLTGAPGGSTRTQIVHTHLYESFDNIIKKHFIVTFMIQDMMSGTCNRDK